MKKLCAILALMSVLALSTTARAATVFGGMCELEFEINFHSPINATTSAPDYDIGIQPHVADFAPVGWNGLQPCVVTGDTVQPARRTTGGSSDGTSSIWSCSAVVSGGSWTQSWFDEESQPGPPSVNGLHTISGTWNDWDMTFTNAGLTFSGVAHLTLSPFDNVKASDCAAGNISSLRLVGVMVFQDPEV